METLLGHNLARLRGIADVTPADLARVAGLRSPAHVGMIERGDRPEISAATAAALAAALGCSVECLLQDPAGPRAAPQFVPSPGATAEQRAAILSLDLANDNDLPAITAHVKAAVARARAARKAPAPAAQGRGALDEGPAIDRGPEFDQRSSVVG